MQKYIVLPGLFFTFFFMGGFWATLAAVGYINILGLMLMYFNLHSMVSFIIWLPFVVFLLCSIAARTWVKVIQTFKFASTPNWSCLHSMREKMISWKFYLAIMLARKCSVSKYKIKVILSNNCSSVRMNICYDRLVSHQMNKFITDWSM